MLLCSSMTRREVLAAFAVAGSARSASASGAIAPRMSDPLVTKSWAILRKGLASGNPEKRRQAVTAVAGLGRSPESLKIVHDALQDESTVVRQTAAAALGEIKAPESIPFLREALNDNGEVAFTAAKSLWSMGDRSGHEVFEDVLTGERSDAPGLMQGALRDARRKMRSPAQLAMMGAREASGALLGPASIAFIIAQAALHDSGAAGRALSATYLAKDPDPHSLELLEQAVCDKNWAVRAAVAKALGDRGSRDTIPKLEPLLADHEKDAVTYFAAASLIRLSSADS
jgi:HEAT repeat protein